MNVFLFYSVVKLFKYFCTIIVLKLMCNNFRSLTDIGLCYVKPCNDDLMEDVEDILYEESINMSFDEFSQVFLKA